MIKINGVTKKYGDHTILENSSYIFPSKGIVCLVGASGGGKTTLLNLLAGFDADYTGEILVGGSSISKMDADDLCSYRKDNVGFVFQNYHLLPSYTVMENIVLPCELFDLDRNSCYVKAKALLVRLGIADKENQKSENLSGGQKQRVAIARALMNDPQIIFADEPTGALDRNTSAEIMELLHEIAQDRLVVIITHDHKICGFADEIIHIQNGKIIEEQALSHVYGQNKTLASRPPVKSSAFGRGIKNFKVHLIRYIAVSLAISMGVLAFLFSLSFGNVMEKSIEAFKEKNTAFGNGYVKGADDGTVLRYLEGDARIENIYYQYKLSNVRLSLGKKTEIIGEKHPMPKATQGLSYGVMPRSGTAEIALSPSLAKKLDDNIRNLLGKSLTLEFDMQRYTLTVSGIYNAEYDDFIVSSNIERQFYENTQEKYNYSISYDVKEFSDIVAVCNALKLRGITSKNVGDEVYALQKTFNSLNQLFFVISSIILSMGVLICAVLLFKLQNRRYREVGILSALGFNRKQIASTIVAENMLLCTLATAGNFCMLGFSLLLSRLFGWPLTLTVVQIGFSVLATFVVVMILSGAASYRLLHTAPAEALQK